VDKKTLDFVLKLGYNELINMPRRGISKSPFGANKENFGEIFIRDSPTGYGKN
jgi:hypothetical protein